MRMSCGDRKMRQALLLTLPLICVLSAVAVNAQSLSAYEKQAVAAAKAKAAAKSRTVKAYENQARQAAQVQKAQQAAEYDRNKRVMEFAMPYFKRHLHICGNSLFMGKQGRLASEIKSPTGGIPKVSFSLQTIKHTPSQIDILNGNDWGNSHTLTAYVPRESVFRFGSGEWVKGGYVAPPTLSVDVRERNGKFYIIGSDYDHGEGTKNHDWDYFVKNESKFVELSCSDIVDSDKWSQKIYMLNDAGRADQKIDGPQPKNRRDWINGGDYEQKYGWGIVNFTITVDVDGRGTDCHINESSSSSELDRYTCKLILERARFTPAHDQRGELLEGKYTSQVRWSQPQD